jgi:hypothetical protein
LRVERAIGRELGPARVGVDGFEGAAAEFSARACVVIARPHQRVLDGFALSLRQRLEGRFRRLETGVAGPRCRHRCRHWPLLGEGLAATGGEHERDGVK